MCVCVGLCVHVSWVVCWACGGVCEGKVDVCVWLHFCSCDRERVERTIMVCCYSTTCEGYILILLEYYYLILICKLEQIADD